LIASGLKRISAKATIIQTETICQLNGDIIVHFDGSENGSLLFFRSLLYGYTLTLAISSRWRIFFN